MFRDVNLAPSQHLSHSHPIGMPMTAPDVIPFSTPMDPEPESTPMDSESDSDEFESKWRLI